MGNRSGRERETEPQPVYRKSLVRDYAETILVCVIFVVFSRAFIFQQSKIPSASMMDTLLVGDYIMVNRFLYAPVSFDWERSLLPRRDVRRGDIVVFKKPDQPETDYIKRVIGLPQDVVELRDGRLHVNGEPVDEPYVQAGYRAADLHRDFGPVRVQPGHYFVMGDHRNASSDSREWGQVPQRLIRGRALLVWWSFDEGKGNAHPTTGQVVRGWGYKITHFFTKTRWRRCFSLIR